MRFSGAASSRSRLLVQGGSRLVLDVDAAVVSWVSAEQALPALVSPRALDSRMGFRDVTAQRAWRGAPARTQLLTACGRVEVRDHLLPAAEPVGRAEPGVALVRLVRSLDGPLDVVHEVRLASAGGAQDVTWRAVNRVVVGYFADRKVTVDGGELSVRDAHVCSRLRGEVEHWCGISIALDGHLPLDEALVAGLGVVT